MRSKRRLFCTLLLLLGVAGHGLLSATAARPVTSGLSQKYGIYFFSEEGADLDTTFGSYIRFQLKAGIGATYDYFIKEGQRVEGRVESYNESEGERQYVLERFFEGKHNALLRVLDMPDCDNMKVAVIQYADEKRDTSGTYLQYILTDGDFGRMPQ